MQQRNADYFVLYYLLLLLLLHFIKMNVCCVAEDLRWFWQVAIRCGWQRFICWWTWTTATRSTICSLSIIQAWQTDTSLRCGTWRLDTSRCGTWWVRGFISGDGVEYDEGFHITTWNLVCEGLRIAIWHIVGVSCHDVERAEGFATQYGTCWDLHIAVWNLLSAPPPCDVEPGQWAVPYHDVEPRNWGWICIAKWGFCIVLCNLVILP